VVHSGSGGGQHFGRFSDGNERERMSFGHRPEALSQWPEYSFVYVIH